MNEKLSNGKRLFEIMKRLKQIGGLAPVIPNLRPSELVMLDSIMNYTENISASGETAGVKISELSNYLQLTPSAVSQTVKSLEAKNLVSRSPCMQDRRIGYVNLLPHAYEVVKEAEIIFSERLDSIISLLGDQEIEQLFYLLNKLTNALETSKQQI
jgi:DNA-binding MarR family transcriptional regulator